VRWGGKITSNILKMKTNTELTAYYENCEFNLTTGNTDALLSANSTSFLAKYGPTKVVGRYPSRAVIRSNQTISVKLNATTNDAVTIASTDSPFVIDGIEFSEIYITNNSGSTAAVKIFVSDSQY